MSRALPVVGPDLGRAAPPRFALESKGFRPFFLCAGVFGAALVPLWLLVVTGVVTPSAYLAPTLWHAHEMIFGYTGAVVAGFLLTAVSNWTRRETLVGAPLLALAALFMLGRVAIFFSASLLPGVPAFVDLAFWPALILALSRPIVAVRDRKHFVLIGVLVAIFAADVVVHLNALGVTTFGQARQACLVALDAVVLIILVIAGRVFPMFVRNATGVSSIRAVLALEVATMAGMAGLTLLDAVAPESAAASAFAGVVAVVAVARTVHWGGRHTVRDPLLWILYIGYAWIPIGLAMRALAALVPTVPTSLATHALTVGAIGSLTLGMMARVALGHTGRPLVASKSMTVAFVLMVAAAVVRVFAPLAAPLMYRASLEAAAGLWTISLLLYVVSYAPILVRPRVDGQQG
jgi:uncharacterized protein involved in response to NO